MRFDDISVVANGMDEDGQINVRIEEKQIDQNEDLTGDGAFVDIILDVQDQNDDLDALVNFGTITNNNEEDQVHLRFNDGIGNPGQLWDNYPALFNDDDHYTIREAAPMWDTVLF